MTDYTVNHIMTFAVVYSAYGSSYLLRMPFGVIKDDLFKYYDISAKSLGYVDLAFLLPYSFVSLTLGGFVEYLGPRLTLPLSLTISALAMCILPYCNTFFSFLLFIFIVGGSQALCWPASCALISNTFESSKSTVFGLFGTCCFIGGIVGKCLALYLRSDFSWTLVFVVPSALVLINSALVLTCSKYFPPSRLKQLEAESSVLLESTQKNLKTLSTWRTFILPGVPEVCFTMFFVKSIRYMFMFWLPLYMNKALNYTPVEAGYASLSFDLGGIFGSCFVGCVSDNCLKGRDILTCLLSILGSTFALILFWMVPNASWSIHVALLVWAGSLNGGSDVLLSGSVATKLGRRHAGVTAGVTSLTGLVNGIGSLGTVLEGPIIGYVSEWVGWHGILPIIILFSFVASSFALKASFFMGPYTNY